MVRPRGLKTKVFLDGGDPEETREVIELLGFLDGQTTNPTLIAKNPEAKARLEADRKFTKDEIYLFYRGIIEEISGCLRAGRGETEGIVSVSRCFC